MTNLNEKISRRKFLQMTAGAAIGAAMLNMPGTLSIAAPMAAPAVSCKNFLREIFSFRLVIFTPPNQTYYKIL